MRFLILLFLLGCGRAAAPTCPAIDGAATLIAPGRTLVLGEIHGTAEAPRFAGDFLCLATARVPSTLALEIPRDEQARIDAFLASGDRAALLAGPFWWRKDQDGRSSEAMLALLERARSLGVPVLAFDVAEPTPERDRAMADFLGAARAREPTRLFLVLTGNYHSRHTPGQMVGFLEAAGFHPSSFDMAREGGSSWNCMSDEPECRAFERPAQPDGKPWRIARGDVEHHDGRYWLGPTTASPPAVR